MLEQLRDEQAQLDAAIAELERSLLLTCTKAAADDTQGRPQRSRAGWTDDARAAVAARMRAYWRDRQREAGDAPMHDAPQRSRAQGASLPESSGRARSTQGWTPEARAQAAARMRARWAAQQGEGDAPAEP